MYISKATNNASDHDVKVRVKFLLFLGSVSPGAFHDVFFWVCSFGMRFVIISWYHSIDVCVGLPFGRDEVVVSQCIELNEELQKVLVRHDGLLSVHPTTTTVPSNLNEDNEEEDAESLYRRLRKGKALSQDYLDESVPSFRSIPEDKLRRPLTIQPPHPDKKPSALNIRSPDRQEARPDPSAVLIPPPPAKHAERERFFREKSMDGVPGHLRGPSSNSSSSCSGSTDYGD